MADLFLILFFLSLICLIVGLIGPDIFSRVIKKELTRKSIGLVFGVAMIMFLVLFGITSEPTEKKATEAESATQQEEVVEKEEAQSDPTPEPEPSEKEEVQQRPESDEEETSKATLGENNALISALGYLNYASFSYNGLIKQLEFEGYTQKEAAYGADNCGADWNEQAALTAEGYLDYSAFSRDGLIEQLEFDGFTRQQAEYGVQAVGY